MAGSTSTVSSEWQCTTTPILPSAPNVGYVERLGWGSDATDCNPDALERYASFKAGHCFLVQGGKNPLSVTFSGGADGSAVEKVYATSGQCAGKPVKTTIPLATTCTARSPSSLGSYKYAVFANTVAPSPAPSTNGISCYQGDTGGTITPGLFTDKTFEDSRCVAYCYALTGNVIYEAVTLATLPSISV
jgi:hypothetical protein